MKRVASTPRDNWQKRIQQEGLIFGDTGAEDPPYWNESAYYEFSPGEIDAIERAALELNSLCLEAVDTVISTGQWGPFEIPEEFHDWIAQSWDRDEVTIVGRFDLVMQNGIPKMLEYNADTPTSLLEASVIQWTWMNDLFTGAVQARGGVDQFNSLHERLIEAWRRAKDAVLSQSSAGYAGPEPGSSLSPIQFLCDENSTEDFITVSYLRDTAEQAGLATEFLPITSVGVDPTKTFFVDTKDRPMSAAFKLYPFEWMLKEAFAKVLLTAPTRWFEPPWKMLLSTKALLPVLWNLFPDHPNLLRADFFPLPDRDYVSKPLHGREGSNVTIVRGGTRVHTSDGPWGNQTMIYQEYVEAPRYETYTPVLGAWMVNGYACGLGVREDRGPVTGNRSSFVPHIIRT